MKTEEKAPVVALIAASMVTPLRVIATSPVGMSAPAMIMPESVVVAVPKVIVARRESR